MRPLLLLLAPLALAGTVGAAWLALPYPDETEATRQWMTSIRPRTQPVSNPAASLHTVTQESEETGDPTPLPDPFHLVERTSATKIRRQPASALADHDDVLPAPADASDAEPPTPVAALPPLPPPPSPEPVPALRLLGTLHRDQHWIAVAELDGRVQRLQVGDVLPEPLGEVLAVREDLIEIAQAGKRLTIRMASTSAASASTAARTGRTGRSASAGTTTTSSRNRKRRLIRPGVPP